MALNTTRAKRSQKRASGGGGGQFMRLDTGKRYNLRFFVFPHEVAEEDFERGLYKKGDLKIGDTSDELEREVWTHFGDDGISNCEGRGCPICAEAKPLMDSKDKKDQKRGKDMSARKRFYLNCVDTDNVDKGMQIVPVPGSVFKVIIDYVLDPEYGEDILGVKGRDFILDKDTTQAFDKMYSMKLRDEKRCAELDDELAEKVTDLFTMDALEAGWSSSGGSSDSAKSKDDDADDDDPDEEDVKPKGKPAPKEKEKPAKPAAKAKPKDDDEEDDNDFEDDDEEEKSPTTHPKRNTSKAKEVEEIPSWAKKGVKVTFDNKGKTEEGHITEIKADEGQFEIETDDSFWDLDYSEVKPAEAAKARKKK